MFTRAALLAVAVTLAGTIMAADKPAASARLQMEGEGKPQPMVVEYTTRENVKTQETVHPLVLKAQPIPRQAHPVREFDVEYETRVTRDSTQSRGTTKPAVEARLRREQ